MNRTPENLPLLLHAKVASGLLGVAKTKFYRLVKEGQIPTVKCGRVRMFPRDGVVAYVDRLMAESSPRQRG